MTRPLVGSKIFLWEVYVICSCWPCVLFLKQCPSPTTHLRLLGEYWVDPNEGDVKDAIVVHCDMENKATCVLPQPTITEEFNWVGRASNMVWLGEDIKPNSEVCIKSRNNMIRGSDVLGAWGLGKCFRSIQAKITSKVANILNAVRFIFASRVCRYMNT